MKKIIIASFLLLSVSLTLAACGKNNEPEEILKGTRVNILQSTKELVPTPEAALSPMVLPEEIDFQDWPQAHGVPTHAPKHAALPKEVRKAWSRNIGTIRGHVVNPPIVLKNQVLVVNSDQVVQALDVATGQENWKVKLPIPKGEEADFTAGLAATDSAIFVTTPTGLVFALKPADGSIIWQIDVAAPLRAAPSVRDGKLFIVSHDNRLFVTDVKDGALVWTHTGIAETLSLANGATPAVSKEISLVAYTSGDIYALGAEDGKFLWQQSLNRLSSQRQRGGLQGIAAAPVIAHGAVFAVTVNGALAAYELKTGERIWRQNIATSQAPWVSGNAVFVLTDDGRLVALNVADGAVRWINRLNTYIEEKEENTARYWSGPILAGQRLLVASSDGYALSINPGTGAKILATRLLKGSGVSVPPIVAKKTLFFLTDDGNVVAFR